MSFLITWSCLGTVKNELPFRNNLARWEVSNLYIHWWLTISHDYFKVYITRICLRSQILGHFHHPSFKIMTSTNPHNVYIGPSSIKDYYNPDIQPPLPLVELPDKLNPFKKDGVRIYAKMMSTLPANNVKSLPGKLIASISRFRNWRKKALNMLSSITPETKTIIEYSSGSTVISMSLIARALYGIDDTRAFLSNKTTMAKLQMMRFFGLNM